LDPPILFIPGLTWTSRTSQPTAPGRFRGGSSELGDHGDGGMELHAPTIAALL